MIIHIQMGKGRQDRDVILSPKLLEALREYWRGLKRKPSQWLFPGGRRHTTSHPITPKAVWYACRQAAQRAGLTAEKIHPHTLRHCFATCAHKGQPCRRHCLETEVNIELALGQKR